MTPPSLSRCLKQGAAVAASFAMVGLVVAGPQLDSIGYTTLPGDRVQIKLNLSGPPVHNPLSFAIDNPARIVIDLADTQLKLPAKNQTIGVGIAQSVSAVEAGGRTRVVLNLLRSVPYELRKEGNSVVVTLDGGTVQAASDPHPTIEELRRRLEERDTLITDLQRRVGELERRIAPTAGRVPPVASSDEQGPSTQTEEAPAVESGAAQAAPGQFEVDEEVAERALERTLVVTGALLLPFGQADIQASFAYIRSQAEAPIGFFEQGEQLIASQKVRRNTFNGNLSLRFGLPFDSQLEVGIPYRYVEQEVITERGFGVRAKTEAHGSGFGDIRLGLAKGLLHERGWWPNLIGRVTWDTASGETSDDGLALGGGFNELQGSLTMTKHQDPLVFIGSVSYGTTFEKDHINPGDQLGFSVGALLAASPETSLYIILNQTFVNELKVGDMALSGSDLVVGTLNFGASSIIGRGKLLGLTAEMGLTDNAPDYSVGISFAVPFNIPTHF